MVAAPARPHRWWEEEEEAVDDPLFVTDEFRMFCFKVLPCSKRAPHDWQRCVFAHPGEKARRRDPRVYTYEPTTCPNTKRGEPCPRGQTCGYSHNMFETWLHPARYRTQMCNDGAHCSRRFCFFAHSLSSLRSPATVAAGAAAVGVPAGIAAPPAPAVAGRNGSGGALLGCGVARSNSSLLPSAAGAGEVAAHHHLLAAAQLQLPVGALGTPSAQCLPAPTAGLGQHQHGSAGLAPPPLSPVSTASAASTDSVLHSPCLAVVPPPSHEQQQQQQDALGAPHGASLVHHQHRQRQHHDMNPQQHQLVSHHAALIPVTSKQQMLAVRGVGCPSWQYGQQQQLALHDQQQQQQQQQLMLAVRGMGGGGAAGQQAVMTLQQPEITTAAAAATDQHNAAPALQIGLGAGLYSGNQQHTAGALSASGCFVAAAQQQQQHQADMAQQAQAWALAQGHVTAGGATASAGTAANAAAYVLSTSTPLPLMSIVPAQPGALRHVALPPGGSNDVPHQHHQQAGSVIGSRVMMTPASSMEFAPSESSCFWVQPDDVAAPMMQQLRQLMQHEQQQQQFCGSWAHVHPGAAAAPALPHGQSFAQLPAAVRVINACSKPVFAAAATAAPNVLISGDAAGLFGTPALLL